MKEARGALNEKHPVFLFNVARASFIVNCYG
jgi:hypothetical protein